MLYEFETFEKYKLPQDYWNEHKRVFEVEKDMIITAAATAGKDTLIPEAALVFQVDCLI